MFWSPTMPFVFDFISFLLGNWIQIPILCSWSLIVACLVWLVLFSGEWLWIRTTWLLLSSLLNLCFHISGDWCLKTWTSEASLFSIRDAISERYQLMDTLYYLLLVMQSNQYEWRLANLEYFHLLFLRCSF